MRKHFVVWLSVILVSGAEVAEVAVSQETAPQATTIEATAPEAPAIEAELEQFRDGLFQAFNEGEYPRMLEQYCHKDVIATWQDGTTSQGHAGVIAEFDKLKQFISRMTVRPTTDKRLILNDGRLVISSGEMQDDYALRRGREVKLRSRWSATLVKENDRWWLVSFNASTNAFDNEVVDLYLLEMKYKAASIAGALGLVVGMFGAWMLARRRRAASPARTD